jgi:hypothetical protein
MGYGSKPQAGTLVDKDVPGKTKAPNARDIQCRIVLLRMIFI